MTSATAFPLPSHAARATRSQWLRLVLPLLAISLLIAVVGAFGYRYLSEEVRGETHRTLTVITEQKRQQIEDWLADVRGDAELYFSRPSQFESLFSRWREGGGRDAGSLARMRALMEGVVAVRGWTGLAVFDRDARAAFVIGEADTLGQGAQIRQVLETGRIQVVDLYRSGEGKVRYGVLAPIGAPGERPIGVAYIVWAAEQALDPLVESWPVPTRTAETYLVRSEDDAVRFLTPLRHLPDAALGLSRPLAATDLPAARAARGARGIIAGGRDYRGVPVLAYAAAIEGTPWLMLAEIDEREAYAGIKTIAWATALAMGFGLLLVFAAAYLQWRRDRERQALAALQVQRAAEARFRVIFEQAPVGVILLDSASGRITEVNTRFAEIVGRRPQELVGVVPASITHPDDVAESLAQLERLNDGRIPSFRINKRYLRPDGEPVWTSVSFTPVQVETEAAPRYLAIVEDIGERKRHERELRAAYDAAEAANAAKSEFLAHMSHEIRTPMNAVLGLAQVLERDALSDRQREMVERIRSAGQSLLAILNDVLDLSKIEAGQLRLEPRPFDLGRLLASLDSLMGQAARAKGLALHTHAPLPAPGPLLGDGLRIEQVLFNLVGNAIKFTERGEVAVWVHARDAGADAVRLRFEVRDSGIGIGPEAIGRLFAPFTQADGGIGRRYGGTGLGLSICKRLVELMEGEIGVDSEPGRGSSFWFELPLRRAAVEPAPAPAAAPAPARAGPRLRGAHLLVVDDSAMNRDLVERALALEGASASLAADGQQAIQLLRTRPGGFDAVLMDVQMPVMDGLAATRLIRSELGLIDLPVIAFTAGVRDEQQAAALAAGANDVLAKPMDLDEMAVLLAKWVAAGRGGDPRPAAGLGAKGAGAEEAFPDIPGIDRERALQRLGRDRALFVGLLGMFVEDNADAADRAREELARGEREAAARRIHTLRSNAGFICALELMGAAGALEKAIEEGADGLDARLAALGRQIGALVEVIAPWR